MMFLEFLFLSFLIHFNFRTWDLRHTLNYSTITLFLICIDSTLPLQSRRDQFHYWMSILDQHRPRYYKDILLNTKWTLGETEHHRILFPEEKQKYSKLLELVDDGTSFHQKTISTQVSDLVRDSPLIGPHQLNIKFDEKFTEAKTTDCLILPLAEFLEKYIGSVQELKPMKFFEVEATLDIYHDIGKIVWDKKRKMLCFDAATLSQSLELFLDPSLLDPERYHATREPAVTFETAKKVLQGFRLKPKILPRSRASKAKSSNSNSSFGKKMENNKRRKGTSQGRGFAEDDSGDSDSLGRRRKPKPPVNIDMTFNNNTQEPRKPMVFEEATTSQRQLNTSRSIFSEPEEERIPSKPPTLEKLEKKPKVEEKSPPPRSKKAENKKQSENLETYTYSEKPTPPPSEISPQTPIQESENEPLDDAVPPLSFPGKESTQKKKIKESFSSLGKDEDENLNPQIPEVTEDQVKSILHFYEILGFGKYEEKNEIFVFRDGVLLTVCDTPYLPPVQEEETQILEIRCTLECTQKCHDITKCKYLLRLPSESKSIIEFHTLQAEARVIQTCLNDQGQFVLEDGKPFVLTSCLKTHQSRFIWSAGFLQVPENDAHFIFLRLRECSTNTVIKRFSNAIIVRDLCMCSLPPPFNKHFSHFSNFV